MGEKLKPIIEKIHAREILDSRGFPTVEVEITASGHTSISAVPSGASTGEFEALELRDNDNNRYLGKGVLKAVNNVINIFGPKLIGMDASGQKEIDDLLINLDGTVNKSSFGANASLGISMACSVVSAAFYNKPLFSYLNPNSDIMPIPMINVLNGGMHADQGSDIQEIMLFPHGAKNFTNALQMASEIFHSLKSELKKQGLSTTVGDEGGFAPDLRSNHEAIELILKSIEDCGLEAGKDIVLALDCAASEFFTDGKYVLKGENKSLDSNDFVDYLKSLVSSYPIRSIEDGMDENDFDGWSMLTNELGNSIQIVGDDLFVTNVKDLQHGIDKSLANSILIKLNQIGTVGETLEAINLASQNNYSAVISHRSGETEDNTIADICVGVSAGQIKTGAPCRSDRTSKYNRLLWIESDLGNSVSYANEVFL